MFIRPEHLHLTSVFPIIAVVWALDSQPRSPSVKTAGWLQGKLILSFFRGQLNEYHELLGIE